MFAYSCYVIKKKLVKNFQNSFKKNNTLYKSKQPLIMAYKGSESAQDNFGKFIHQFQPETKTLIRKLERILIKLYKQNVSLLFNQTCLNERLLPNHTHTHTHTYMYISSSSSSSCRATSTDIPWPSLATSPYRSSPLAGLQCYIPYPHIAVECMFVLVVLLLLGHMWGSIGVHHLWARPCFSSSILHVWFV